MAVIILGSFLKPVRTLPEMGFIDKYQYFLMFVGFGLLPFFWSRGKLLALDALMYASLFFTLTSFVIVGAQIGFHEQTGFAALFVFPASTYFIFRYISFSEESFIKCLYVFVVIGVALIILEFLVGNYLLGFPPFAFADFVDKQRGNKLDVDRLVFMIPFLGSWFRVWGQTGGPQATGSLFAALAVFFFALSYYRRQGKNSDLLSKLFIFLSMVGLLLTGSKTGVVILLWMSLFILFGFSIVTSLIVPIIGFFGVTPFYLHWVDFFEYFQIYYLNLLDLYDSLAQTDYQHWFYTLFGQGEETMEFSTQVGLIEIFLQTGFFNYLVFLFILITYIRYGFILGKQHKDHFVFAGLLFSLSITLGSLHYETLFVYPCNVLVLAFMGFTAKQIHDLTIDRPPPFQEKRL